MALGKGIFLMFNIDILTVLIVVHWISKYKYIIIITINIMHVYTTC